MTDGRALCLHGLGGTGATLDPVASALRAAGWDAVAPTLPGHGTRPEDLLGAGWDDWASVATARRWDLIVGQSMGAGLAFAAAAGGHAAAVVAVNPPAPDPDAVEGLVWRRSRGHEWVEGPSLAPGEAGYTRLPIDAVLAMAAGIAALDLAAVTVPVLIVTSADDDVVDPAASDLVGVSLGDSVDRLTLTNGGHVATLGPQQAELVQAITAFAAAIRR